MRRCGKSVLLRHSLQQSATSSYYFNFEDERLVDFTVTDFQLLQEVLIELFGLRKKLTILMKFKILTAGNFLSDASTTREIKFISLGQMRPCLVMS